MQSTQDRATVSRAHWRVGVAVAGTVWWCLTTPCAWAQSEAQTCASQHLTKPVLRHELQATQSQLRRALTQQTALRRTRTSGARQVVQRRLQETVQPQFTAAARRARLQSAFQIIVPSSTTSLRAFRLGGVARQNARLVQFSGTMSSCHLAAGP